MMVEQSNSQDKSIDQQNWVYINGLGERDQSNVTDSDVLTAISFDKTGDFLAVGDKGGRVIVFRYNTLKSSRYFDYRYFTEIQSHEPEFDHLKSIELDEKINAIEFVNNKNSPLGLLSTNDRVIKLFKVEHKVHKQTTRCQIKNGQLALPKSQVIQEGYEGVEKKQFKNCHNYNINSLSMSPDGENFLSADDLRVNLWSLENSLLAFNIVDLKPPNIEELAEVITHVEYHPVRSDIFIFSSSKGYMCQCDLRMNSQFEKCSTFYMIEEDPSRKHFFTDIINSISRAKFSPINDNYIFSRDYLAVQIWDVRQTRTPFKTFNVTDYLEKKLCEVYESETIFDKFDLQISPDSKHVLTGSYNSNFHVIDIENQSNCTIDAKFMDKRGKNVGQTRYYKGKRLQGVLTNQMGEPIKLDMTQKISLGTWHPQANTFAVAKHNSLFLYTEKKQSNHHGGSNSKMVD